MPSASSEPGISGKTLGYFGDLVNFVSVCVVCERWAYFKMEFPNTVEINFGPTGKGVDMLSVHRFLRKVGVELDDLTAIVAINDIP